MNERRLTGLLIFVGVLVLANIAATLYFGLSRPASGDAVSSATAAREITEKEAAGLVREVVNLFNEDRTHDLYQKFDKLVQVQFSERKMSEEMTKLHSLAGKVEDYAYLNSEIVGKEGGRSVVALNYKARLSGGTFSGGTIRVTLMKKDEQLALLGFFVNAQSIPGQ